MKYLRFVLLNIVNIIISLSLTYGVYRLLMNDIGNSTGALGEGIFNMVVLAIVFLVLLILIGAIIFGFFV